MSNPWLKKNPFMSMWLSGANRAAGSVRGQVAAEAKRQSTLAINKAGTDWLKLWTGAATKPIAPVATSKRRKPRK